MVVRIIPRWSRKPVGRPARPAGFAVIGLAAMAMAQPAMAASPPLAVSAVAASNVELQRSMWFAGGDPRAALQLIGLLQSSKLDGLNPKQFKTKALKKALRNGIEGDPQEVADASYQFDRALYAYVVALRSGSSGEWAVIDREAAVGPPSAQALLAYAAAAPSLDEWLDAMPFMHPNYAVLRRELAAAQESEDFRAAELLRINLARTRFLPGMASRYVMVNAAAQRLYMYDNGRIVDSMKVVVGKPAQPTPMMAALIRYTAVNPYWNVPSDLAAERIAPNVVKDGLPYLKAKGYVVLSDWGDKAKPVDPATIDWKAVTAGKVELRLRQNPGPGNSMGRMKFMFPNSQGIYLHDTPNKELMAEDARLFSGGCVRLEDAPRLAKWLYGKPLKIGTTKPEQKVNLPKPVPVYLTYLTAVPTDGQIVYYDDIYGRDRQQMALHSSAKQDRFAAR